MNEHTNLSPCHALVSLRLSLSGGIADACRTKLLNQCNHLVSSPKMNAMLRLQVSREIGHSGLRMTTPRLCIVVALVALALACAFLP